MKKTLVCIIFISTLLCENIAQNLSHSYGFTNIFQYPNGPNISNSALPNAEGKITYSFLNAKYFRMNAGIGVATHNFLLKDISENQAYGYLRAEPFASLSAMGCLPEESNFLVNGIYAGVRAGFFNQWNFTAVQNKSRTD